MAISQQILTILKGMTICMKRKFDPKKIDYLEGDIIGMKKKWISKKWQLWRDIIGFKRKSDPQKGGHIIGMKRKIDPPKMTKFEGNIIGMKKKEKVLTPK